MPTIKPALFASLLIVRPSGLVHLRDFAQIHGMYFLSVCHNSKQTLSHYTNPHDHRGHFCSTLGLGSSCSTVGWADKVFLLRPDMTLELYIYISNLIHVHSTHIVNEVYKSDVFAVDTNGL